MELKNNTTVIFKNKYKHDGDNLPMYSGQANIEGKIMNIALWVNEDKNGKKFFAGMFSKPKQYKDDKKAKKNENPKKEVPPEEDLPF